jgi:hypothetical protein
MDEDRKGGRGKCPKCGQWENNVAYHEAWECAGREPVPSDDNDTTPTEQFAKRMVSFDER